MHILKKLFSFIWIIILFLLKVVLGSLSILLRFVWTLYDSSDNYTVKGDLKSYIDRDNKVRKKVDKLFARYGVYKKRKD